MFYPAAASKSGSHRVTFLPAQSGPCPVCGHPTGDCKGDDHFRGAVNILPPRKKNPMETFTVSRRVYEEEVVNGRKRRRLLYGVGEKITFEEW